MSEPDKDPDKDDDDDDDEEEEEPDCVSASDCLTIECPLLVNRVLEKNSLATVVPRGGIEPPTRGFSVLCSTD